MGLPALLPCDGCGQLASAEHIAARLRRLEWATRFRPIHVQALLLAEAAPELTEEFLYNPETRFAGRAGEILDAVGVERAGKSFEEVLGEFQKRGLVLASVLECPVEASAERALMRDVFERHLPSAVARIRRSLKPKRVLIVSEEMVTFVGPLSETALGCPVFYTPLKNATYTEGAVSAEVAAFRAALPALAAQGI